MMLVFWNNGFLRQLILLGVWLFGNNENEILVLDQRGERHVDVYGSDGSPFARLMPELHGGELEGPREWHDRAKKVRPVHEEGRAERAGDSDDTAESTNPSTPTAPPPLRAPLTLSTLLNVLAYTREGSPMPLAVAAAGPQLRLAGEQVTVFFFPGAATSLLCGAGSDMGGCALARAPRAALLDPPALLHGGNSTGAYCRVVRGPSLSGVTAAMRRAAWWYGRPCPSALAGGAALTPLRLLNSETAEVDRDGEEEEEGVGETAATSLFSAGAALRGTCLPLRVEVSAPRVTQPFAASSFAPSRSGACHVAPLTRVLDLAQALARGVVLLLAGRVSDVCALCSATPLDPNDAGLRAAAAQFVSLVDLLWRQRRCPLTELTMERHPVAMTEWMLSPELHTSSSSGNGGGGAMADVRDVRRTQRAFQHVRVLRCRGRISPAAVVTVTAPNAAATAEAVSSSSAGGGLVLSGASAMVPTVPGRGLHPASPAAASAVVLSLSLTAVRSHVRLLDLSNTTTLFSLDGIGGFAALEKIVLTRCSQLRSLSPLGAAPALRDIVASQSGIADITGLAQSRTLASLSLYGCLHLTDVSSCGAIPTLRDVFISESTVVALDGLRVSRSLTRLGMRYCSIPLLTALSPVSSLTILHAASSALTSVEALQHCVALEVVEVSACAQLTDLGPLGLAPSLREVDATGSGVRHVAGLSRSFSLEKLLLGHCAHLSDIGPLRDCDQLRALHLSGTPLRHLEGLAGSPSLEYLDISFCRQLTSYAVLPRLPQLCHVCMAGCTAAQRRTEEVAAVLAALTASRSDMTIVLR